MGRADVCNGNFRSGIRADPPGGGGGNCTTFDPARTLQPNLLLADQILPCSSTRQRSRVNVPAITTVTPSSWSAASKALLPVGATAPPAPGSTRRLLLTSIHQSSVMCHCQLLATLYTQA